MNLDEAAFFKAVNGPLFNGRLTRSQMDGIRVILDAWNRWGNGFDSALAYVLATAWWETGRRMVPVRETFANSTEQAVQRLDAAYAAGKLKYVKTPYWRSGYFGRGLVQLTHEANYNGPLRGEVLSRATELKAGPVDMAQDPDVLLIPIVSAFVLIEGMIKGHTLKGDFTGKSLEQFVCPGHVDFVGARAVVNPGDAGSRLPIAGAAEKFDAALKAAKAAEDPLNPHSGEIDGTVRQVQGRLTALGWVEVGVPDGRWGERTRGAVLAFRSANGLPLKPEIDDQLLAALMRAQPRGVSGSRAVATAKDLASAPPVAAGNALSTVGQIAAGAGAVLAGLDLSTIQEQVTQAQSLVAIVRSVGPAVALVAVGLVVVLIARRAIAAHVAAHREGRA